MYPIQKNTKSRLRPSAPHQEKLLEQYYDRLQEWALLLTRGDIAKAQDIVHELCLHLTLSAPDQSKIRNLDGYLYTCLRHFYLSDIARSTREGLQSISADDFDSVQIAFRSPGFHDPLQQQNDLRRICAYVRWRKPHAKSASYFILRFFHGYFRREVASIAGVPLSTIDPKLNKIRSEVHLYLVDPGKLKFTSREVPPDPPVSWKLLPSLTLFRELREAILSARAGDCLPEQDLLAHYQTSRPAAIPCTLLSHIVSCERCLSIIDQHFKRPTLKDREPLDALESNSNGRGQEGKGAHALSREAMLRSVRRYSNEVLDHRPRTLSIAVDGKILASRDVRSEKNMLSARIERPENASFIEVFSEQGIRLAFLALFELPPDGPHRRTQHVDLSDDRWLELTLTFDALGLKSEVTYIDPALAIQGTEEETPDLVALETPSLPERATTPPPFRALSVLATLRRFLLPMMPSPLIAWSLVLACAYCLAGFLLFHNQKPVPTPLDAGEVLSQAVQAESARSKGQTEHQVLHFEEASLNGNALHHGTIELWRDGDRRRYMRRLYDGQDRLVAAEWIQGGQLRCYPLADGTPHSNGDRELLADGFWKQDVSPVAFRAMNGDRAQIQTLGNGSELTIREPQASTPQLISATLTLDRHLHAVRETMRVRTASGTRELHFVESDYERRPSASVPDAVFDPNDQRLGSKADRHPGHSRANIASLQLAELHIAVLYQLNSLNADASDPLEVAETPDGHIRVTGMVKDDDRKEQLLSHLLSLENHQCLQAQILSRNDVQKHRKKTVVSLTGGISVYDVGEAKPPADALILAYFQAQGLSHDLLDAAVSSFSREVLGHSQRALQNASALQRLTSFSASELRFVSLKSQQQWTEMAAKHAAALELELRALHQQLALLSPSADTLATEQHDRTAVNTPADLASAAARMLAATKRLDRDISDAFASSQSAKAQSTDIQTFLRAASDAIPLEKAIEITGFTAQLNASANTAGINRRYSQPESHNPRQTIAQPKN